MFMYIIQYIEVTCSTIKGCEFITLLFLKLQYIDRAKKL